MGKNALLSLLLLSGFTSLAEEPDKISGSPAVLQCEDSDHCQRPIEHIGTENRGNGFSDCVARCAKAFPADIRDLFDTNFETCKASCLSQYKPSI